MRQLIYLLKKNWPLLVILLAALILRSWKLGYQSFWLDELYTANETDPKSSWIDLYHHLKWNDSAPPLFFIFDKIALSLFGSSEFVARSVSAIAGTLAVGAMYFFGKEILNKQLGLIAAILTTVNYYGIYYSQEARVYSFAFLFTILSFTWLVKLVKSRSRRDAILYAFFTLCLLYSHYYSLFVVVSQALLGFIFLFNEDGADRKNLFRRFVLSSVVIVLGYLPMIPLLLSALRIYSSWIQLDHNFLTTYFFDYFGSAGLLKPLLLLLLFTYFAKTAFATVAGDHRKLTKDPLAMSFVLVIVWIFVTLLLPYIKSLIGFPMLYGRYTIVVLPAIILVLAYGIELFSRPIFRWLITALFVILSLTDLVLVRKYYQTPIKTQFREMTAYVVSENNYSYPLNNQISSWQQGYYLKRFHSTATMFAMKAEDFVDSILKKTSPTYDLPGFWLVGAHGGPMLAPEKRKELDSSYQLAKEKRFLDAWAQLFVSKTFFQDNYVLIRCTDFTDGMIFKDQFMAIWNGSVHTKQFRLHKGKNRMIITAMGTPAAKISAHVNIYVNDKKIGDYYPDADVTERAFVFDATADGAAVVRIELDNDLMVNNEDRNVLIDHMLIEHLPHQ